MTPLRLFWLAPASTLKEASQTPDPSQVAKHCLAAARHFTRAVTPASIDTGPEPV
ncbi:hypothetical protein [Streptomyces spirodelae]|uniref:Uncharacterized protein n=1 Tax=Streptomyces spirodelae TaxID=2812904 RepID=A0ABS3X1R5_9ACTN|nr:hypothetical protein [Streptomyces spirodelae]MBO8189264.1 hypothetical protein [Streptomyces spirodelae]